VLGMDRRTSTARDVPGRYGHGTSTGRRERGWRHARWRATCARRASTGPRQVASSWIWQRIQDLPATGPALGRHGALPAASTMSCRWRTRACRAAWWAVGQTTARHGDRQDRPARSRMMAAVQDAFTTINARRPRARSDRHVEHPPGDPQVYDMLQRADTVGASRWNRGADGTLRA